jgi:hypothetical protein
MRQNDRSHAWLLHRSLHDGRHAAVRLESESCGGLALCYALWNAVESYTAASDRQEASAQRSAHAKLTLGCSL